MKKIFKLLFTLSWYCLFLETLSVLPLQLTVKSEDSASQPYPLWLKWLFWILICLLCIFLVNLLLNRTRTQIKKMQPLTTTLLIVLPFVFGGLFTLCFSDTIKHFDLILGCIMFCLLLILTLNLMASSKYLGRGNTPIMWETTILFALVAGLTLWVPDMWGITLPEISLEGDLFGYYTAQLSLTFITISVMSVLSDKSVIIYWENVAEAKLIRPLFASFASFTAYSIAATVGAGISVILDNDLAFCVFFAANVLILILLTLTMVDVYYGRDRKKRIRAMLLRHSYKEYKRKDVLDKIRSKDDLSLADEYVDIMYDLQHHLHQEIEAHNISYIREVAELYGGNMECFETSEGKKVRDLLYSSGVDITPMIVDGIGIRVSDIAQKHETANVISRGTWYEDYELWAIISTLQFLEKISADKESLDKFTEIFLERLSLIVTDVLNNQLPLFAKTTRNYRSGMRLLKRNKAFLHAFLNRCVKKYIYNERWAEIGIHNNDNLVIFLANLKNIALVLSECSAPRLKEYIVSHPVVEFLLNNE